MSATLEELPDRHRWTLADHRIVQLAVEVGACRLLTWTLHASLELQLAAPFSVRQADGIERTASPDEPEQLAPLLTLVGRTLDSVTLAAEGELVAAFSDGTIVAARPHARREAWRVQGGGALEGVAYRSEPGRGTRGPGLGE